MVTANIASRLEPSTPTLQTLIAQIDEGEVKIPAFQRRFVWTDAQALRLLDSLASNYPVGSLLLWKTVESLASERNIGDFQLPETDDHSPTDYVLDGQQRLTVIYSCLGAAEGNPGFAAGYDLLKEVFVELPGDPPATVFPLRILFNTTRLLNFRTALQARPDHELMQQRLDELVKVLTNYRLPVVTLKHLTLDEVCPIFERINSSGTRLSIYDLMVAATWSSEFDLDARARAVAASLEGKNFDDVAGTTILKILAAITHNSTERKAILGLRTMKSEPELLDSAVTKAQAGLERAVDFIVTDFGLHSLDFLPYEAHLVILTAIFSEEAVLDHEQTRRARQWFWRSALTEHYRGASDSFVTSSMQSATEFIVNGDGSVDDYGAPPQDRVLLRLAWRKNSAGSRAFALAMAKLRPRNLTNGAMIDTYAALSVYNRHQFHHIYPQAHLKRLTGGEDPNRLMNICMLTASENNRISDEDPTVYFPKLITALGEAAPTVFKSNLLPMPDEFQYSSASYEEFLTARVTVAASWLKELCDGDR